MSSWKPVGVVIEGEPLSIGGTDVWGNIWRRIDHSALTLPHPSYPKQMHQMSVYEAHGDGKVAKFAAGEVSANVYAFYVPV